MNKYELALVINGRVDEETKLSTLEKVKEYVDRFGGTISKVDEWGKRKLAYEINKIREGFYYFIHFESNADTPSEIEKRIRIMESILRFLIIRQED